MKTLLAVIILCFVTVSAQADPIDVANARIAAEQQAQDDEIAAVSKTVQEIADDLPPACLNTWAETPYEPWPQAPALMDSSFRSTEIILDNPFTF